MVSERTVGGLCCLRLRQGGVWPTAKFDRSAISFSLVQFSTLYPWVLPWHQRSREFRLELPWSLSDLNPDGKSSCVLMGKEMDVNSQLFQCFSWMNGNEKRDNGVWFTLSCWSYLSHLNPKSCMFVVVNSPLSCLLYMHRHAHRINHLCPYESGMLAKVQIFNETPVLIPLMELVMLLCCSKLTAWVLLWGVSKYFKCINTKNPKTENSRKGNVFYFFYSQILLS